MVSGPPLELARQAQTTYPEAMLLLALAEVTGALGGPGTTRSYAHEALAIASRNGYEALRARALTVFRTATVAAV